MHRSSGRNVSNLLTFEPVHFHFYYKVEPALLFYITHTIVFFYTSIYTFTHAENVCTFTIFAFTVYSSSFFKLALIMFFYDQLK